MPATETTDVTLDGFYRGQVIQPMTVVRLHRAPTTTWTQPATAQLDSAIAVRSAVFSPKGAFVLTASDDRAARIWDVSTGLALWTHRSAVTDAQFARKGKVVHFEAHGLADVESKKPMARDTLFRMASSSKPGPASPC